MAHIPQHLLLPQDMVDVLDKETGAVTRMHSTSFKEAVERDPERYVLAEKQPEPITSEADDDQNFGAEALE